MCVREKTDTPQTKFTNSREVRDALWSLIGDADREHFVILILNTKNQINAVHTVSIGNLSQTLVHPREVFKAAILGNAASIILAHNHPSGDPTPSRDDELITSRLRRAGNLLGINLLDHVILGDEEQFFSFADEGQLGQKMEP